MPADLEELLAIVWSTIPSGGWMTQRTLGQVLRVENDVLVWPLAELERRGLVAAELRDADDAPGWQRFYYQRRGGSD